MFKLAAGRPFVVSAQVDREEALSYLGFGGQAVDPELEARLDRACAAVEALTPRAMVARFPLADRGGEGVSAGEEAVDSDEARAGAPGVALAGTSLFLEGRDIARHLEGAVEAVLLVVTLGFDGEMLLRRERATGPTDAMLADACASALVESAANTVSYQVEAMAKANGLRAGSRFSPGYGDLPLSVQRPFLAAVGADRGLGISVTDAHLLVPTKTITAVTGLFAVEDSPGEGDGEGASTPSPAPLDALCDACSQRGTCPLRAAGRTCHGH